MSKLAAFLDRSVPHWRAAHPWRMKATFRDGALGNVLCAWQAQRALAAAFCGVVWWAQFAGVSRASRRSRTVALTSTTIGAFSEDSGAETVESAEALVAGTIGSPRLWALRSSEPIGDHSRVIGVDGILQPSFGERILRYPSCQRAYLRSRCGIVFPRAGLVMPKFGAVLRNDSPSWLVEHRFVPGFVDLANDKLLAREGALHPARRIRRPVLILCHAFHRNYAHWLFDCLPWLMPWLGDLRDHRLAVLVPPLLGAWQRRTLELLGLPASAVIEAPEESLLCTDMIVSGMVIPHPETPTDLRTTTVDMKPPADWRPRAWPAFLDPPFVETIETLRSVAWRAAHVDRPERIYVSRRGLESFRTMQNEHEVEAALARLGFAIVRPQDHSFDEQVAMFSRARVVVGPHGAGLTNTAFAPQGCLVIDIFPDTWNTSWVFRLTQRFEHYYLPVVYPSDPDLSRPLLLGDVEIGRSHVYRVPANGFASVVAEAMRSPDFQAQE